MYFEENITQLLPLLPPDDPFHEIGACLFFLSLDGNNKIIITVIKKSYYNAGVLEACVSRLTAESDKRVWV